LKALSLSLLLVAAAAFAPSGAGAHHGKKEEHAQPAAARGGCAWVRSGKTFASLADCMKGGHPKRSCRGGCK
jgi:hypothetical protein